MEASKLHKHRAHVTLLSDPTVHSLYCDWEGEELVIGGDLRDTSDMTEFMGEGARLWREK